MAEASSLRNPVTSFKEFSKVSIKEVNFLVLAERECRNKNSLSFSSVFFFKKEISVSQSTIPQTIKTRATTPQTISKNKGIIGEPKMTACKEGNWSRISTKLKPKSRRIPERTLFQPDLVRSGYRS